MGGSGRGAGDGPFVLVVDVGSSSTRCGFYDRAGRGVDPGPRARALYRWDVAGGAMEATADGLLEHVAGAVDGAHAYAREHGIAVAAVAVTTFWHSLLGLDARGTPVTPLTGWGDSRAAGTAARLRERVDPTAYHRRTGCYLHPSYPAVRLAWLAERGLTGGVGAWVSFAEYLESRLFGERRCTLSMASGTGLLDVHRLHWSGEVMEMAGVSEAALSPLVDHDAPAAGLLPRYAARWPDLSSVPWYPALGDGACANLGSGAVGPARQGATIGTSAAVRVLVEPDAEVEIPDELWAYRLDARSWVVGGALSNGGNALEFLHRTLRLPPAEGWDPILASTQPDAHGLTVLPSLVAERSPGLAMLPGATVSGLRLETTPEEIVRAWLEAVVYRVAQVSRRLESLFGPAEEVRGSGGALRGSGGLAQMLADALGRRVVLSAEREETSRGAALMAMRALGWLPAGETPALPVAAEHEPDDRAHARYGAGMRRHAALHETLRGPDPTATTGVGEPKEPDGR